MSEVINGTDTNFEAEVLQSTEPVLVDFSAAWCGPCKKLEPIVHELAGDYAGRLKVVKVDIDQAPTIASAHGVMSVPTVMLFKQGEVKDSLIGLNSKKALSDRIDQVLAS